MNIIDVIKNSVNKHDCLKKLGWDTKTYGYRKLNKFIIDNNIDISHFHTRKDNYLKTLGNSDNKKKILSDILISGSTYSNTTSLKRRLYIEGFKEKKCEKCGQDENWNGEHMSLILDHINGIHNDNRIDNLRILCPNCNATLPTHCGRNIKEQKKKIKKTIIEQKENKKNQSINARKNIRPNINVLLDDIKSLGYKGTGNKYGVSDNAIRKWVKFYKKYN